MRTFYYRRKSSKVHHEIKSSSSDEVVVDGLKASFPNLTLVYRFATNEEYEEMNGEQYVILYEKG